MVTATESDRYPDTVFSVADTPPELNRLLFEKMMTKTGEERLTMGCHMTETARELVWSGIPKDLDENKRQQLFYKRFYGEELPQDFPFPNLTSAP